MFQTGVNDSARLEDYLRSISERKLLVLLFGLLGMVGFFYLASSRTDSYTSNASVVLYPTPVGATNTNLVPPNLEKERAVAEGVETANTVAAKLANESDPSALLGGLTVAFRPDSDVLIFSYTSGAAASSAELANLFASSYVENREGASKSYYQNSMDTLAIQAGEVESSLGVRERELAVLTEDRKLATREVDPDLRASLVGEFDGLIGAKNLELRNLRNRLDSLNNEIGKLESAIASRSDSATVLKVAGTTGAPNGLGANTISIAGLILGLIGGVIAAFLADRLDTTAKGEEDVALALGGKVIGSIPTLGFTSRRGSSSLVQMSKKKSASVSIAKEGFRRLRSAIQFIQATSEVRSIIVTSAYPGEGKSVVAGNVAVAFAQNGIRTALVSADLRRPTQELRFGIDSSKTGLSTYLGEGGDLVFSEVDDLPNLFILPAGQPPENPGELLGSSRFGELIKELEDEVDLVIIDTPPLLSTADALAASKYVDGVIVVVDSRKTDVNDLLHVRSDLERAGATLLGAVLNRKKRSRRNLFWNRDHYSYHTNAPT